jgi:hypothetical protein
VNAVPIALGFTLAISVFAVWATVMTREHWWHAVAPPRARVRSGVHRVHVAAMRHLSHASPVVAPRSVWRVTDMPSVVSHPSD